MADIHLTMGFTDYDHVRDMFTGRVKAEGIDLTCLRMEVEESFLRFLGHHEWDISEMSMGFTAAAVDRGDAPFVVIPVFPSRVFRLSGIYVRADGSVDKPEDLAGKRVAMPQWSQTATIYMRGWITETVGIPLTEVDWVQLGAGTAGRLDTNSVRPPEGVRLSDLGGGSLADMLVAGEIDAVFSASPPEIFKAGDSPIRRLIPDYPDAEKTYFRDTGIFPIMHTVVIKRTCYEANPWIARNLFNAFEAAKANSLERMHDLGVSHMALPWIPYNVEHLGNELFPDGDYWPYGIEGGRTTIEAFLRFCYHQGVTQRHLAPEDLFVPEAREPFARLKV